MVEARRKTRLTIEERGPPRMSDSSSLWSRSVYMNGVSLKSFCFRTSYRKCWDGQPRRTVSENQDDVLLQKQTLLSYICTCSDYGRYWNVAWHGMDIRALSIAMATLPWPSTAQNSRRLALPMSHIDESCPWLVGPALSAFGLWSFF